MRNNNGKDLSQPPIDVAIPQVRMRLRDLAYLRSLLVQPTSVRYVNSGVWDRLLFLDLIVRSEVPPSEDEVRGAEQERQESIKKLLAAVEKQDWYVVEHVAFILKRLDNRLQPKEEYVVTERGKKLLELGEITQGWVSIVRGV